MILYWDGQHFYISSQQNMINGVYLSQLQEVRQTHLNHHRKLEQISRDRSHFTHLDCSIQRIVNQRKSYHQRWKQFQLTRGYENDLFKKNSKEHEKIRQIQFRRNKYCHTQSDSPTHTRGNYFYLRKKQEQTIDEENPQIAKRILKARGSIDMLKSNSEFWESRKVVHRLQRYPIAKRMQEYSQKKICLGLSCATPERDKRLLTIVKRQKSSRFQ